MRNNIKPAYAQASFLRIAIRFLSIFLWVGIIPCWLTTTSAQAQTLTASWYSMESLKKEGTYKYSKGVMANGERFNENNYTCAIRDYPLNTILKVTNLANGLSVQVTVTDRIGKRFAGKRIDLSRLAFSRIAKLKQGIIQVKIEVISLR